MLPCRASVECLCCVSSLFVAVNKTGGLLVQYEDRALLRSASTEETDRCDCTRQRRTVSTNVEIRFLCVSAVLFGSLCMGGLTPSHLSLCFFLHISLC